MSKYFKQYLTVSLQKLLFYFKKLDGLSLESFILQLSTVKFLISSSLVYVTLDFRG